MLPTVLIESIRSGVILIEDWLTGEEDLSSMAWLPISIITWAFCASSWKL